MSRGATTLVSMVLLASLSASVWVLRRGEAVYPSTSMEDVLFMPSPEFVKRASLGYSGLLAGIYWMRVVQYFGGKHMRGSMQYKALAPLLDMTTTLDPHLIVAYEWGSTFLEQPPPSGAGDEKAAVALIQKGIQNNPDNWHLYMTLGFLYYFKHDYEAASKAFEQGANVPGANPALRLLAARMMSDAGSIETARYMWQSVYQQSTDKDIKRNAELHLACLLVDEEVPKLQAVIDQYRVRFGHNPGSWRDLIQAGWLRGLPLDPTGAPYVLRGDGEVVVGDINKLPFIHAGKPS